MQFTFITKVLAILATCTLVLSAGLPVRVAREARSISNVQPAVFRGEAGGHAYELTSTAEQVWAQLKERYPEIQHEKRDNSAHLEPRNKVQPPLCIPVPGQDWEMAPFAGVQNCVYSLWGMGRISIQGHSCEQICCNGGAQVWLCNDNDYEINPSAVYLATYAMDIGNSCQISPGGHYFVGGQEFDTDNYNIIVQAGAC